MSRIQFTIPDMSDLERKLLLEAFDSNWIAPVGPQVEAFEVDVATVLGVEHTVALASGTAALHLALVLLGIRPGDDVVVPTLTYVATANAVRYMGARPVFLDSEPASWTVDPNLLEEELGVSSRQGRLPAAVISVDLFGQCADYGPIQDACACHGVPLVEDAAEALGASYRGRPAGAFGELAALSFNGNKIVTTGGGGMLVTSRADWAERARRLAAHAAEPAPHFQHAELGFSYGLSNLAAAIGRGQLQRLHEKVERCRAIKRRYCEELSDVPGLGFMPDAPYGDPTAWLTVATIDEAEFGASATRVREALARVEIDARPAWKPMHLQPLYAGFPVRGGAVAEEIFRTGLCLPGGSGMSDTDLDRVIAALRSIARRR